MWWASWPSTGSTATAAARRGLAGGCMRPGLALAGKVRRRGTEFKPCWPPAGRLLAAAAALTLQRRCHRGGRGCFSLAPHGGPAEGGRGAAPPPPAASYKVSLGCVPTACGGRGLWGRRFAAGGTRTATIRMARDGRGLKKQKADETTAGGWRTASSPIPRQSRGSCFFFPLTPFTPPSPVP